MDQAPQATDAIIDSASTILARDARFKEIYLVLRAAGHRSFPSTYVFPGGQVDAADAALPVAGVRDGVGARWYAAAARELFEETGVLVATGGAVATAGPDVLAALRTRLLDQSVSFGGVLADLGGAIDGTRLQPLGVKTTPPFSLRRFRNRFFVATLPPGQEPSVIAGELERGEWIGPGEAARSFEEGRMLLAPPVLMLIEEIARTQADRVVAHLTGFDDDSLATVPLPVRFSAQVIVFAGRTPTLPPATHTNTYFIGKEKLIVVDPATRDPVDRPKLEALMRSLLDEGRRVEAIVLTHHHPDHTGAVDLIRGMTGAPVLAHPLTAARLSDIALDATLRDGQVFDLGSGAPVRVVHTPGHTRGHVALLQEHFGALIAGDMVSTVSTIVLDPPEGDLAEYLASLDRLAGLPARMLYPAHGPPTARVAGTLAAYVEHRRWREARLVAALERLPQTIEALTRRVYDDVPAAMHGYAARSLLAGLEKLAREGRARREAAGAWSARSSRKRREEKAQ